MGNYVYTSSATDLKTLLATIKDRPPPKNGVTDEYLIRIGMGTDNKGKASGNAKAARSVIQAMGIIDEENMPTEMWSKARTKFKATMLEGLQKLYPEEDSMLDYENAEKEQIIDWFRAATELASATQSMCAKTFWTIQAAARGEDITPTRKRHTVNRTAVKTEEKPDAQLPINTADSEPEKPHHPLITGLFREIPKEGETWSQTEQDSWFALAKMVFKQVFKENIGETVYTPPDISDLRSPDN